VYGWRARNSEQTGWNATPISLDVKYGGKAAGVLEWLMAICVQQQGVSGKTRNAAVAEQNLSVAAANC